MTAERWSAWSLAEAFHLAHAADFIVAHDLLDDQERAVETLARTAGVDAGLLSALLGLLEARTDLVARGRNGFRAGPGLGPVQQAVIDQYVGAYGPNAAALADLLAGAVDGRSLVDRHRHAIAFGRAPGPGSSLLPDLLERLELNHVVDVGCGTGDLLVTLACRDANFRGWGIDANPAMIHAAETRLHASPASPDQVRFHVGNATDLPACLPDDAIASARTVVVSSLLNELFDPGPGTATRWLDALARALPHRLLVVLDYYGKLGHTAEPPPQQALHDWVQRISGQGIPPPDLDGWEVVYRAAGCELLHAIHDDVGAGVFIHLVRLAAPPSP